MKRFVLSLFALTIILLLIIVVYLFFYGLFCILNNYFKISINPYLGGLVLMGVWYIFVDILKGIKGSLMIVKKYTEKRKRE